MTETNGLLVVGVVFAVVNAMLLGFIAWQLWVVRARVNRLDLAVASLVGGVVHRVCDAVEHAGRLIHQLGRAVERVTLGR